MKHNILMYKGHNNKFRKKLVKVFPNLFLSFLFLSLYIEFVMVKLFTEI